MNINLGGSILGISLVPKMLSPKGKAHASLKRGTHEGEPAMYLYTITFVKLERRMNVILGLMITTMLVGHFFLGLRAQGLIMIHVLTYLAILFWMEGRLRRRHDPRPTGFYSAALLWMHLLPSIFSAGAAWVVTLTWPYPADTELLRWLFWGGFSYFFWLQLLCFASEKDMQLHPIEPIEPGMLTNRV